MGRAQIRLRKHGTIIAPGGHEEDEEDNDGGLADECGGGMPALPKEYDEDDDGRGGGHGALGLGQAQAIDVGD